MADSLTTGSNVLEPLFVPEVNYESATMRADMNAGRLCGFILLMLCASGAARSQTVAETAKLAESEQRAIIAGFVDNSLKNLGSHTDRTGKSKSAAHYELDRALANFARAFFTQDATHPNDAPPGLGAILQLIKKEAAATPDRTVVEVTGELVDGVFAHFYTDFYTADKKADFAKKTDADQVALFRLNIELYQNDRAYQRVIKQFDAKKSAILAEMKEMYDNSVILADGRHVMRDQSGDFIVVSGDPKDRSEVKLVGPYRDEAQRLYNCMNAHRITNGLKGREVCAAPIGPAAPAAATVPPAAPVPPPASSSDDDPIGSGGFITPPNQPRVVRSFGL